MIDIFRRKPEEKNYIEIVKRWVIIDDHRVLHDHYRATFELSGYQYIPFKSGFEFQRVKSNNRWGLDEYLSIPIQSEEAKNDD